MASFLARQALQKLAPDAVQEPAAETPKPAPAPSGPGAAGGSAADTGDLVIKVKGVDDLLVYRAKCCNPIRGEGDRRIRDPRQRHRGALQELFERAEPDV